MAGFVNNVLFTPTLGGTTDWVVSAAAGGFNTPAGAGAVDGMTYKYRAESADLSQWEVGEGIYTSGTTTLTRASVSLNSLGTTAKINFSTVPQVGIVTLAQDLLGVDQSNSWSTTQQAMARLTNLNAGIADLWERVGAEPSLDLLADDIAGLFTTARSTTATYWDSDGLLKTAAANVPRVQYNPVTRQNEGYLYETTATNLLLRSQEFGTTWGVNTASITTNGAVAPDGTTTADKLVEDGTNAQHYTYQGVTGTTNTNSATVSVFAKADTRSTLTIRAFEGTTFTRNVQCDFNLSTGAAGAVTLGGSATSGSARIEALANGWYRCSLTYVLGGADTTQQIRLHLHNGTSITYTGDGASGLYLWGAQLEAASFANYPSSYIPTTSATVARGSDSPLLTTDLSWLNESEGTLLVDITPLGVQAGAAVENISLDNGGSSESHRIRIGTVIAGADYVVLDGGVAQVDTGTYAVTALVRTRMAIAYAVNDFAFCKDGATPFTDAAGSLPSGLTRLALGTGSGGAFRVHRVAYWPKRLTNAQLQLLTAVA